MHTYTAALAFFGISTDKRQPVNDYLSQLPPLCAHGNGIPPVQGQSVFHNAQELEEFAGGIAKIAESEGDFIAAGETQETDGGVAKGG